MKHDMDGFWPVRPGSSNTLWNALSSPLSMPKLNGRLTASIAVCLLTDGWTAMEWDILMGWGTHRNREDLPGQIVAAYEGHEAVHNAARANSLSVTRADGLDWLRVVAKRRRSYIGPVPVWTRRALRDLREERGCQVKDLWRELDLPPGYASGVARWHAEVPKSLAYRE